MRKNENINFRVNMLAKSQGRLFVIVPKEYRADIEAIGREQIFEVNLRPLGGGPCEG